MGRLSRYGRYIRAGLSLVVLATVLASPIAAFADRDGFFGARGDHSGDRGDRDDHDGEGRNKNLNCPGRETLVRVDENICPANPHRPVIIRKRACCQNPAGRVHCDHFEHCPRESES
ncbi:MAG TPA: hypothetical protein VGK30_21425 [Candidatus Binatia bacterium]|jgi:hypothetical protein